MSIPTVFGVELSPGTDLGLEDVPDCCGRDMAAEEDDDGGRTYSCEDCGTDLVVTESGMVLEIFE
jgi:hypothetical protein